MNNRRKSGLVVLMVCLLLAYPVTAGVYEQGVEAYERGDYETALARWRPLADEGDARAQLRVGDMYGRGQGVTADAERATEWYRKAAEQELVEAQFRLGKSYDLGRGVEEDRAKAAEWWRKAADQGHPYAQFGLGVFYSRGMGVPQDFMRAHMWLHLAGEQGIEGAEVIHETFVAGELTPKEQSKAERLAEERKAEMD